MAQDITLTELIALLSELFTNMNNLDKTYYDMFYNPTAMDITLERYDANGTLQKVVLPNRAKDKDNVLVGYGDPEGKVAAGTGKLYMDSTTAYLYYKTQGTALAPTVSGWMLVFTVANAGKTFQLISEKGQANGYAPLNSNRKVPAEYLEATELTYYDTKKTCNIEITLKTILTWACTNAGLNFDVTWTGTDADTGIRTVTLREETQTEHPINTDVVQKFGEIKVDTTNGVASNFNASSFLKTSYVNTKLNFAVGTVNKEDEVLTDVDGKGVKIIASATKTTVETNREDLVVSSTFTGVKPIGTQEDIVSFKDKLEWHNSVCVKQGDLTIDNEGKVSGFSAQDYLAPVTTWNSADTYDLVFTTGEDITTGQALVGNNMSVAIKDGYLGYNKLTDKNFSQVVEIQANTTYYLQVTYDEDKTSNVVKYSTDGEEYTEVTPGEAGNLFLLGTLATGKGVLDGESNVPFLGTVDSIKSAVTSGGVKKTFAEITHKWYNQADKETTLAAHDLELTSGDPVNGDIVTVTYVTNKPMINNNEVEMGKSYNLQYVADDTDPYTFYPQVEINDIWEPAGEAIRTENVDMLIGKGVFNGSVNLLESKQDVTTTVITKNYTEAGSLSYNLGIASDFSADNYITVNVPTEAVELSMKTADKTVTETTSEDGETVTETIINNFGGKIFDNPGEVINDLHVNEDGVVVYTNAGTEANTDLTLTVDTSYVFKATKTEEVWGIQYSTDDGANWTDLAVGDVKDFTSLFSGETVDLCKEFTGTVDVMKSIVDGMQMYVVTREVGERDVPLAQTVNTYKWLDNDGKVQSLALLGLNMTGGTPVTGDVLTLTYTTTEF